MKNNNLSYGDVDIDFPDRNKALSVLEYTPASIIRNQKIEKHNTGVYFHMVPVDPVTDLCSVSYEETDQKGWFKTDLLNVGVYELVKNEQHLVDLMKRPIDWSLFTNIEFVSKLIHLNNHAEMVRELNPKSINDLSMVLALIRPGKRHLVDRCIKYGFNSISKDIWTGVDDAEAGYSFKHGHALSYAVLVVVHANVLLENNSFL